MMSGIYGILVVALAYWGHRRSELSTQSRYWLKWTVVFMITEALLGAKLVRSGLVADNDTPQRAFVMGLHFFNSLLLTGSFALAALFAAQRTWRKRQSFVTIEFQKKWQQLGPALLVGGFLLIGITGTVAALSNTLYPPDSLLAGLWADLNPHSHYLVRLRGLHPTLGILAGLSLAFAFYLTSQAIDESERRLRVRAMAVAIGFVSLVLVGSMTLLLQDPLPLRLMHLCLAHMQWILVLAFLQCLFYEPAPA